MTDTLTIVGNIASGKSTLMPRLAQALSARAIDADSLFQTTDPFAKPFLADMSRWAFTNEVWLTVERAKIMKEALEKKTSKVTLVDSGLLMSWVYAYSHLIVGKISQDEWNLYHELYDQLTDGLFENTKVVKLSYSIDTLMQRLQKRGRDFELAFYTREYLGQLELGLSALQEKLVARKVTVIEILEKDVADFEENSKDMKKVITAVSKWI